MANSNTYTDEYRRECADYAISSGRPATQIARELGLNEKTFARWVVARRRELSGQQAPGDPPEVRELRRRNRELEMENEFLKKAAAFFAREQQTGNTG